MSKLVWPGSTQLAPVPVVLVGCGDNRRYKYNLITVAWAGTVSSEPPRLAVAIRPERFSFGAINTLGEFTVNLPSSAMAEKVDFCGVRSGREIDKFAACNFTPLPGTQVNAPLVAECPLALECRVMQSIDLGAHTLFIADILAVQVEETLVENDKLDIQKADLIAFAHGGYYALGELLGTFGYSVRRRPAVKN